MLIADVNKVVQCHPTTVYSNRRMCGEVCTEQNNFRYTHMCKKLFLAKICKELCVQPSSQNLQTRQYKMIKVLMCTCLWHEDVKIITSVLSNRQLFMFLMDKIRKHNKTENPFYPKLVDGRRALRVPFLNAIQPFSKRMG